MIALGEAMKAVVLILLVVCGILSVDVLNSESANAAVKLPSQSSGTETNPLFVQRKETDDDKAASAQEVKERKLNLSVQGHSLIIATETFKATKDAADSAKLAAYVGVIMAVIAIAQFFMFGWQLRTMQSANQVAKDSADAARTTATTAKSEFEASHRPWIKVQIQHMGDLVREQDGWALQLSFKMENFGDTVAQNVYPYPRFYAGEGFVSEVKNAQLQLALNTISTAGSGDFGLTIFPGDSLTLPMTILLEKVQIETVASEYADLLSPDSLPPLYIIGSVHYKSTNGDKQHRTGFVRQLYSQSVNQNIRTLIPNQDVVKRDELAMSLHISGDGYVD
jgi:hypothetical protein